MYSSQDHRDFEPLSSGALMDPEYLRDAVRDNHQEPHTQGPSSAIQQQWQAMVHSFSTLFRRH